jgi:hypothetical protein
MNRNNPDSWRCWTLLRCICLIKRCKCTATDNTQQQATLSPHCQLRLLTTARSFSVLPPERTPFLGTVHCMRCSPTRCVLTVTAFQSVYAVWRSRESVSNYEPNNLNLSYSRIPTLLWTRIPDYHVRLCFHRGPLYQASLTSANHTFRTTARDCNTSLSSAC